MAQVNILAIGNSFSEDATHFLHQIAKAGGIETMVVNLYIGGCPLALHWQNIEIDAKVYQYQRNGKATERYISIKEALMEEEWDFIITQQASHDSGLLETYEPYLHKLYMYIRECVPKAEVLLQETWAYEIDSTHDLFIRYNCSQKVMYEKLYEAYHKAADSVPVRLIPCGEAVQAARRLKPFQYENGGMSLCRDGFHMHYVYGRYLLAAVWYEFLFQRSIFENKYVPSTEFAPGAQVDLELLTLLKNCAHEAV